MLVRVWWVVVVVKLCLAMTMLRVEAKQEQDREKKQQTGTPSPDPKRKKWAEHTTRVYSSRSLQTLIVDSREAHRHEKHLDPLQSPMAAPHGHSTGWGQARKGESRQGTKSRLQYSAVKRRQSS